MAKKKIDETEPAGLKVWRKRVDIKVDGDWEEHDTAVVAMDKYEAQKLLSSALQADKICTISPIHEWERFDRGIERYLAKERGRGIYYAPGAWFRSRDVRFYVEV